MKNKIMLITYSDSFGKNLKELKQMVDTYFKREINGIHILPFFRLPGTVGLPPSITGKWILSSEPGRIFRLWRRIMS